MKLKQKCFPLQPFRHASATVLPVGSGTASAANDTFFGYSDIPKKQ